MGSSFQHAVVRSINDKNAQLQKQLENLVREGSVLTPRLPQKARLLTFCLLCSGQRDQPVEQQIIW
jgi:hypothetical protein